MAVELPPEIKGILDASTVSADKRAQIEQFFAQLSPEQLPEIMRNVRIRANWQDKIAFLLQESSKVAG